MLNNNYRLVSLSFEMTNIIYNSYYYGVYNVLNYLSILFKYEIKVVFFYYQTDLTPTHYLVEISQ